MTLRRRIAEGLRKVAAETTNQAVRANAKAALASVAAMSARAIRALAAATVFVDLANIVDPGARGTHPDGDAASGRSDIGDQHTESRPAAGAPLDRPVGEPLRAGAVAADKDPRRWASHDVDGSTVSTSADLRGDPVISVQRSDRLRVVRGGRA
jgi:hypothetical protein